MVTETVGKRYSKRTLIDGGERIDDDANHLLRASSIGTMKGWALATLRASGIDVDAIFSRNAVDGWTNEGEALRHHVSGIWGTEPDDMVVLAARIYELCRLIELCKTDPLMKKWVDAFPLGSFRFGFELGRLSMLAKAYGMDKAKGPTNKANATRPRPDRRAIDHDELLEEFKRLVREGHTEGNARGILKERGLASQATIYRVTKAPKKSVQ